MFKLSKRSLDNLEGVNPALVAVVKLAITRTEVDFGVIEGLRTRERQVELVRAGASQTMKSKHLNGMAVDLMAYVDGRGCWELHPYFEVAKAMRNAALEFKVPIRWGGAWQIWDQTKVGLLLTHEEQNTQYIRERVNQGRRPFVDAPHFELVTI